MGAVVKQDILIPVGRFEDFTEELAQRWVDKGREEKGIQEDIRQFKATPVAYVYTFAALILSLRDGTNNASIEESGRCHHVQGTLCATSRLIALTNRMQEEFTESQKAIAALACEREKFCAENSAYCDISTEKLTSKGLPTIETVYTVFCNRDIPQAVMNRIEWVENKYMPPDWKGRMVSMLQAVAIDELLPSQNKRKYYNARPVLPDAHALFQRRATHLGA